MTDPGLTIALRNTPASGVALKMRWRDLLFLHFSADPEEIQNLLPAGLSVDTFPDESGRERAWVGLVPFRMEGVRPKGFPKLPRCERFPETNVRTYCHLDGRDPGVWFFSLDASNLFACLFARFRYHLNYRWASMSVMSTESGLTYVGLRNFASDVGGVCGCTVGPESGPAKPGTLEFFLVERYLLYSAWRGRLFRGQVYHPPYVLREISGFHASSTLVQANGITPRPFTSALFSRGLDVAAGRVIEVART